MKAPAAQPFRLSMLNPSLFNIRRLCCGLLIILGLLPACTSPSSEPAGPEQDPAEREAVLAVLDSLPTQAMEEAFARLREAPHTRTARTMQFGEDGAVQGARTYRIRWNASGDAEIISVDSTGAFDFGLFEPVVSDAGDPAQLIDPLPLIFPDDPAFASPRNQEAFYYQHLPDTTMADRSVRRLDIRARPDTDQSIQHARYYLDAASGQVIGVDLSRINPSFLFREESRFQVFLRPDSAGTWWPSLVQADTRISLPGQTARAFRTRFEIEELGR